MSFETALVGNALLTAVRRTAHAQPFDFWMKEKYRLLGGGALKGILASVWLSFVWRSMFHLPFGAVGAVVVDKQVLRLHSFRNLWYN